MCDYALPLNIQKLHDDLAKYRINYDKWFLESTLHNNGAIGKVVNALTERGKTFELSSVMKKIAYLCEQMVFRPIWCLILHIIITNLRNANLTLQ